MFAAAMKFRVRWKSRLQIGRCQYGRLSILFLLAVAAHGRADIADKDAESTLPRRAY